MSEQRTEALLKQIDLLISERDMAWQMLQECFGVKPLDYAGRENAMARAILDVYKRSPKQ